MSLIDDIRKQARAETRLIDAAADGFAIQLDEVLASIDRQIRRLVGTLDSTGGRLVSTEAALGRALRTRTEIAEIVRLAGCDVLAAPDLDELAVATLRGRTVAAQAARATPVSLDVLTALQEIGQADLLD